MRWVPGDSDGATSGALRATAGAGHVPWMAACAGGAHESFTRVTGPLARQLGMPLASFTLLHEERQVIESAFGLGTRTTPAEEGAFARACLSARGPLVVPDATLDPRFRDNPLVANRPFVRFYAGVPVQAPDGLAIGILNVVDTRAREWTADMAVVLDDMAAIAEEMLLLLTMSAQDRLTRLLGRGYFVETFGREWRRAQRERSELSLVMIDVDHFKAYNDHYGHPSGDGCLQWIAGILRDSFRRPADVVFRYGGEEFAAALPGTPAAAALALTTRAVEAVARVRVPHAGSPLSYVTISAGVASARPAQVTTGWGDLLTSADQALYAAKAAGRNVVRHADALATRR